jgi:nitrous oxidase accessory protein NosD
LRTLCYIRRVRLPWLAGLGLSVGLGLGLGLGAGVLGGCSAARTVAAVTQETAPAQATPPEPAVSAGPAACPDGFARDPAGGAACGAIVSAAACSGATRAALGSTTCLTMGDCSAAFPDGAKVVTDPSTLAATIAGAAAGSTIALEAGTYPGIVIDKDLTLVGRCAERVIFAGSGAGRGISVNMGHAVLRGLSVTNFQLGVAVPKGATLDASQLHISKSQIDLDVYGTATLSESVIEGGLSTDAAGVWAASGAKVDLHDVETREIISAVVALDSGTTVTARRSVLGYTGATRLNFLVSATAGASLAFEESTLRTRAAAIAFVGNDLSGTAVHPGSTTTLAKPRFASSELSQHGSARTESAVVQVDAGGALTLDQSSVLYDALLGVTVKNPGATADLTGSVLTASPSGDKARTAFFITHGGAVTMSKSAIIGSFQNALFVGNAGSTLSLDHSLVSGTRFGVPGTAQDSGGMGIAVGAFDSAALSIVDTSIVDSDVNAIYAGAGARLELTRATIDGVHHKDVALAGMGVVIEDGAIALEDSTLRGCDDAAIAFFHGEGVVHANHFTANGVGVHVQSAEVTQLDEPRAQTFDEVVLAGNVFEDGELPLRTTPIDLKAANAPSSSRP